MPTLYTSFTEKRALEEFKKKIEEEEGILSFEMPDPPDIIVHTNSNRKIWAEVTSVHRTKDSAKFLNQHGMYNSQEKETQFEYEEELGIYTSYISQIKSKIKERIEEKDSKKSYEKSLLDFGKGTLILYIDDMPFTPRDLEQLLKEFEIDLVLNLKKFNFVYLYVPTSHSIRLGQERQTIEGLYLLATQV